MDGSGRGSGDVSLGWVGRMTVDMLVCIWAFCTLAIGLYVWGDF